MVNGEKVLPGGDDRSPDSEAYQQVIGEMRERYTGEASTVISVSQQDNNTPKPLLGVTQELEAGNNELSGEEANNKVPDHLRIYDIRYQLIVASRELVHRHKVKVLAKVLKAA